MKSETAVVAGESSVPGTASGTQEGMVGYMASRLCLCCQRAGTGLFHSCGQCTVKHLEHTWTIILKGLLGAPERCSHTGQWGH